MQKEENVYGETTLAELSARAQERKGEESKEGSTVLGKFKDVDALARAYSSLEAEFTRRSQKIKELEREVENLSGQDAHSGAEKLRKNAESRRVEEKRFDEFVQTVGKSALEESLEPTEGKTPETTEPKEGIPSAEEPACKEKEKEMGNREERKEEATPVEKDGRIGLSSSEEVYRQVIGDEKVRLRIIGEYLSSIGRSGAPITANGGGVLTTPPTKIKSIGEAGNLALQYFKKGTGEN